MFKGKTEDRGSDLNGGDSDKSARREVMVFEHTLQRELLTLSTLTKKVMHTLSSLSIRESENLELVKRSSQTCSNLQTVLEDARVLSAWFANRRSSQWRSCI